MIKLELSDKEKENLTNEEIEIAMARKLEIMLLPHLRRHIRFFYAGGNLKGKAKAYRQQYSENALEDAINSKRKISTVCKPLCEMVAKILQENGLMAETVSCDTDMFRHTDVLLTTKSGKKYIINFLEDMENIQTGMRTPDFASESYYKRRYEKFENGLTPDGEDLYGISFLSEEELGKIDTALGYKKYNMYMDEVIAQIKSEFLNFRNIMAENDWLTKQLQMKNASAEEQAQAKAAIYEKYNNMTKREELEAKLDWIFNYFNDRMDISGHTDFVMYYSRLLLKNVLSQEEYDCLDRYDCFAYKDKIPDDCKIREVLDFDNTESGTKLRFCLLKLRSKMYAFSTKPKVYTKLNEDDFEELESYANLSKSKKPSDLMLYLCDRGNALPLVFHPLGATILNERADLLDKSLEGEERLNAIKNLSNRIITTDKPVTSITIPYDNGKTKYLYINEDDEFVVKEGTKETIYHYNEHDDTFSEEIIPSGGNKDER